ncbi:MAG TPA: hypothetical protein VMV94_21035 [Phycisphaerae bacterium]|nr:hypothetical protein [Phycisphaerae bacterium]
MTPANDTSTIKPTEEHAKTPLDPAPTPGCYVCRDTGNLYRIPADAIVFGRSPLLETASRGGSQITKIADDPYIPINRARQLCADADVHPSF